MKRPLSPFGFTSFNCQLLPSFACKCHSPSQCHCSVFLNTRMAPKHKGGTRPARPPPDQFALDSKLSVSPMKFPFAGYTSIVGVHSTLLLFVALFLPRTTILLDPSLAPKPVASQLTSRDKPQHPFLEPLTLNPTWTMACVCAGAVVLQAWWGGWIRRWWIELVVLNGTDDQVEKRDKVIQKKLKVRQRATGLELFAAVLSLSDDYFAPRISETDGLLLCWPQLPFISSSSSSARPSLGTWRLSFGS